MHVSLKLLLLLPWAVAGQSTTTLLTNPATIPCPSHLKLVRSAGSSGRQSLSPDEDRYVSRRADQVLPGEWKAYLKNVQSTSSTPLPHYVSDILSGDNPNRFPKLGIAVSGGGYRAALFGAGVLTSLDARNTTAAKRTGTGGLLQAASYLAGLSGGSWLVTALAQANFPTIPDLVFPPEAQAASSAGQNALYGGFNAQIDLFNVTPAFAFMLLGEIKAKHDAAGFPVTIVDIWSRALARHFVNGTTAQDIAQPGLHGAGVLFSDISSLPSFTSHAQPFPIIVADSLSSNPNTSAIDNGNVVPLTDEIWEFNVYETGSFDPSLASFIPTKLLGSTNASNCVAGFDQAAYVAGISSDVFPIFNTSQAALQQSPVGGLVQLVSSVFPNQTVRLDSAAIPNPFKGVNPNTYSNTNESFVSLLDGGLDGEVLPLQPLLVRARGVDTIIAIDVNSNRDDNFADGTSIISSAKRAALFNGVYPFPPTPPTSDVFISQNLTRRPTFFGCNDTSGAPLIIYIANGAPPAVGGPPITNTSFLQSQYSPEQVRAFLDQSFEIATQGAPANGSATDAEWGACLACAVVDRARLRSGAHREGVCTGCFARYCFS